MNKTCFLFVLIFSALVHSGFVFAAVTSNNTLTWYTLASDSHVLKLWSQRCMSANSAQDLNVTVSKASGGVDTGATVTAILYKPTGGTEALSFASQGDGNYTKSYSFDQNGTYKLVIHSSDVNFQPGDLNEYIYVVNFDFNIAFVNNSFSVVAGNAGTIQNFVTNSDNNAVTGISGTLDIAYPAGSSFVSAGTISETGNGYYYHNFTAPNTNGTYTATSRFTCGPNTDSNSAGRFTVTGASSGSPDSGSGSTGGSGGSGGGGGYGGGGTPPSSTCETVFFPDVAAPKGLRIYLDDSRHRAAFAVLNVTRRGSVSFQVCPAANPTRSPLPESRFEAIYSFFEIKTAKSTALFSSKSIGFSVERAWIERNQVDADTIELLRLGPDGVWQVLSARQTDVDETRIEYEAAVPGFSVFGIRGTLQTPKRTDAVVTQLAYAPAEGHAQLETDVPNHLAIEIENRGPFAEEFLAVVKITQGLEVTYYSEVLIDKLNAGEKRTIELPEPWVTALGGSHKAVVSLYSRDQKTRYHELTENLLIRGTGIYDVIINCPEGEVAAGDNGLFTLQVFNAGDYFSDVDLRWWIASPRGERFSEHSAPIAVYPKKASEQLVEMRVPGSLESGAYTGTLELVFADFEKTATCQFYVSRGSVAWLVLVLLAILLLFASVIVNKNGAWVIPMDERVSVKQKSANPVDWLLGFEESKRRKKDGS